MRFAAALAVFLAAGAALADRLVSIPTGTKLRNDTFRTELQVQSGGQQKLFLDSAIGSSWEMGLRSLGDRWTMGASYNYIFPIIDVSPGISVGVDDLAGITEEGRGAYLAMTYYSGNTGEQNQDVPTEVTVGVWARKAGGPFFGVTFPFTSRFKLIIEHDSRLLTTGFEFRPVKQAGVKVLFVEGAPTLSLSFQTKF